VRLRLLSRSPLVYWAAVAALALVTALAVSQLLGRARVEAARYGTPRSVLMATRDIALGDHVGAGDVVVRRLPAALVPPGTVPNPNEAVGRVAVVPIFGGEAVLRRHLAPWGRRGVAALLPPGTRGITVAAGAAASRVTRGDLVDVLATFDPIAAPEHEPTFPVATGAVVVDVREESVTIAVAPEEAKRVAFATARGAVTLTVTTK
jgi:Flp pilus assembly protein CpaB